MKREPFSRPRCHLPRIRLFLLILSAVTLAAASRPPVAAAVPPKEAERAANAFCRAIVSPVGAFSYWDFGGKARDRMKPLLSRRLLAIVDSLHACFRDWARHQPADTTDKPPGVDCCVFSASADWMPNGYALQSSKAAADGRRRVTVEYRFDSSDVHARWHVALYIAKEGSRYVVDDFEGGLDGPESDHWFLHGDAPECRQGKWIAGD